MKLYVSINEDRHYDTQVEVFTTAVGAIDYAYDKAKEYCRSPEDYKEHEIEGWLFCADYDVEGASFHVVETELHK